MADELITVAAGRPHDDEREFTEWMQRYLDASLEPVEVEKFNARLRAHSRWRTMFARSLMQATFLEEQLAQDRAAGRLGSSWEKHAHVLEPLREFGKRERKIYRSPTRRLRNIPHLTGVRSLRAAAALNRRWMYVVGGLAAAVLLLAVLWSQRAAPPVGRPPASFVAKWIDGNNGKWDGDEFKQSQLLPPGREIKLAEGIVEVQFGYGARAVIESPARIEIADASRMILWEGSAVFHVPESAVGFTVDTASFRAVDLGTEFAIRTTAAGDSQIYVFQGKVRVEPASTYRADVELTAGRGAVVSPTGKGTFTLKDNVKVDPAKFKRKLGGK